jgi:hypothetical protein
VTYQTVYLASRSIETMLDNWFARWYTVESMSCAVDSAEVHPGLVAESMKGWSALREVGL